MPLTTDAIEIAGHLSPSRVVFGPHETNLGEGRCLSVRHVAYYRRRASGGTGIVVTETASVHSSDWPYERAPLASLCGAGWRAVGEACASYGTVVLAGLGHCGGQGSSAYSQSVLWAPSRVADAATRETPAEMEADEIGLVVDGFELGARLARESGLAGVEVDAGPRSLLRQFHSGLTNLRGDRYGQDRVAVTKEVLEKVRHGLGRDGLLALRLSCDELAPWAGVTAELAGDQLDELVEMVDMVTVVRGGPYSVDAYRPGQHGGEGFNEDLTRQMRGVVAGRAVVVLQGSVVDAGPADRALAGGVADMVEMTRAQIAEPSLVGLLRAGTPERIRPCILCNQTCCVRDARNPVVSCVGEPSSGYEMTEPTAEGRDETSRDVLVVGGGPAGLECARVLALRGHRVRLVERSGQLGGAFAVAGTGPGRDRLSLLTTWLERECARLEVVVELRRSVTGDDLDEAVALGIDVVLATGSRPRSLPFRDLQGETQAGTGPVVVDALALLGSGLSGLAAGPVVLDDPIGGPIGVGVAEWLAAEGREVAIVTQDQVVGTGLSRSGDLAAANGRLQRAGVRRELRAVVRGTEAGRVVLEDVWTGERRSIDCAVLVDCGHRVADAGLAEGRPWLLLAGDCVAPRTVLEAVLEGRRRALEVGSRSGSAPVAHGGLG